MGLIKLKVVDFKQLTLIPLLQLFVCFLYFFKESGRFYLELKKNFHAKNKTTNFTHFCPIKNLMVNLI